MEPRISVEPDAVAGLADAVELARDGYRQAGRPYLDQLAATAATLSGWGVGAALDTLESWWHDDLTALAGHLTTMAERLDQAAAAYRRGEQASRDLFWNLP